MKKNILVTATALLVTLSLAQAQSTTNFNVCVGYSLPTSTYCSEGSISTTNTTVRYKLPGQTSYTTVPFGQCLSLTLNQIGQYEIIERYRYREFDGGDRGTLVWVTEEYIYRYNVSGAPQTPSLSAFASSTCYGGSITFTATGGTTYKWYDQNNTLLQQGPNNTYTIQNNNTGSSTVNATIKVASVGCVESAQVSAQYQLLPLVVTPTISKQNSTNCTDAAVEVKAVHSNATSYKWFSTSSTSAPYTWQTDAARTGATQLYTANGALLFIVGVSVMVNGCESTIVPVSIDLSAKFHSVETKSYNYLGQLISSSASYSDFAGRAKQSQSKEAASGKTFISETVYDVQGRAILQTMPAATENCGFYYDSEFLGNFSYANVDQTSDFQPGTGGAYQAAVDPASKLGKYFSDSNPYEAFAPTTKFPYSLTEYFPDQPARVRKASQPGDNYHFGTGRQGKGIQMLALDELNHYTVMRRKLMPRSKLVSMERLAVKGISEGIDGKQVVSFSDLGGNVLATAMAGPDAENPTLQPIINSVTLQPGDFLEIHITHTLTAGSYTVTGTGYTVKDLYRDATALYTNSFPTTAGFYRIRITGTSPVTFRYPVFYHHFSYNFYDYAGRLIYSVAPNGTTAGWNLVTETLPSAVPSGFPKDGTVTFLTKNVYNSLGWLLSTESTDEGKSEYVYRKDGTLRYSQNAKQKQTGNYSYVVYDAWSREVEVGQMNPGTTGKQFASHQAADAQPGTTLPANNIHNALELANQSNLPAAGRVEWSKFSYDASASDLTSLSLGTGYQQTFMAGRVAKSWNANSESFYSYTYEGLAAWTAQKIVSMPAGSNVKLLKPDYNANNTLASLHFQPQVVAERMSYYYTYDILNRTTLVETSIDGGTTKLAQVQNIYDIEGKVKRQELGGNTQGVDFTYTLQGWLKAVNHPSLESAKDPGRDGATGSTFMADAFGMALDYHPNDYTRTGSNMESLAGNPLGALDHYDGKLKAFRYRSLRPDAGAGELKGYLYEAAPTNQTLKNHQQAYLYNYDPRNQLQNAYFGTVNNTTFTRAVDQRYDEYGLSYDANGNIQTLKRNAIGTPSSPTNTLMDNLAYHYYDNTNKLKRVNDAAGTPSNNEFKDFAEQTAENNYEYDALGQMTKDNSQNIRLEYTMEGLVSAVFNTTNNQKLVEFLYDEFGQRLKKTSYVSGAVSLETWYVMDAVYEKPAGGTLAQAEISIPGGVFQRQTAMYQYTLSDHLGNARVVITRSTTTVRYFGDYYPFGWGMPGRSSNDINFRYGYQGQERDAETGYAAFELRMWDGRIGRWMSPDPYGQFASPYLGMGNMPNFNIDPDGGWSDPPWKLSFLTSLLKYAPKISWGNSFFAKVGAVLIGGTTRNGNTASLGLGGIVNLLAKGFSLAQATGVGQAIQVANAAQAASAAQTASLNTGSIKPESFVFTRSPQDDLDKNLYYNGGAQSATVIGVSITLWEMVPLHSKPQVAGTTGFFDVTVEVPQNLAPKGKNNFPFVHPATAANAAAASFNEAYRGMVRTIQGQALLRGMRGQSAAINYFIDLAQKKLNSRIPGSRVFKPRSSTHYKNARQAVWDTPY